LIYLRSEDVDDAARRQQYHVHSDTNSELLGELESVPSIHKRVSRIAVGGVSVQDDVITILCARSLCETADWAVIGFRCGAVVRSLKGGEVIQVRSLIESIFQGFGRGRDVLHTSGEGVLEEGVNEVFSFVAPVRISCIVNHSARRGVGAMWRIKLF